MGLGHKGNMQYIQKPFAWDYGGRIFAGRETNRNSISGQYNQNLGFGTPAKERSFGRRGLPTPRQERSFGRRGGGLPTRSFGRRGGGFPNPGKEMSFGRRGKGPRNPREGEVCD